MEQDPEVKGQGNSYTTEFRQYDPRLGRWLSLDPLMAQFPHMSPYAAFDNNPIVYTDPYGLSPTPGDDPKKKRKVLNSPVGNVKANSTFKKARVINGAKDVHIGTDYPVPTGTNVQATASGKVVRANFSSSYGNVVILDHGARDDGQHIYTLYAHNSKLNVSLNQKVDAGDVIAQSGSTGHSTGPHVHYEVVVTKADPNSAAFYGNLDIRYGPEALSDLLHGEAVEVSTPPNVIDNQPTVPQTLPAEQKNEIHNNAIDQNTQFHQESIDWADDMLKMMKELNKDGIFDDRIKEMEQYQQDHKKEQQHEQKRYRF